MREFDHGHFYYVNIQGLPLLGIPRQIYECIKRVTKLLLFIANQQAFRAEVAWWNAATASTERSVKMLHAGLTSPIDTAPLYFWMPGSFIWR